MAKVTKPVIASTATKYKPFKIPPNAEIDIQWEDDGRPFIIVLESSK